MHVDELHVPRVAGFQASGAHAQRLRAADGGQIERPIKSDQRVRHSPALIRRTGSVDAGFQVARHDRRQANHRVHARIVSAGDVGAEPDRDALPPIPPHRRHRVREIRVGQWAVGHGRASPREQVRIGFGQVYAVVHDRTVGQQPEHVKRLRIRPPVTFGNGVVLPVAFRTVRLGEAAVLRGQRPQSFQSLVGAAGDEPRGDDRLDERRCRVEAATSAAR